MVGMQPLMTAVHWEHKNSQASGPPRCYSRCSGSNSDDSLRRVRSGAGAGGVSTFYCDAAGQQWRWLMAAVRQLPLRHRAGRLQSVTGTITYSYDGVGNRTHILDPQGATTYAYDGNNREFLTVWVLHQPLTLERELELPQACVEPM